MFLDIKNNLSITSIIVLIDLLKLTIMHMYILK